MLRNNNDNDNINYIYLRIECSTFAHFGSQLCYQEGHLAKQPNYLSMSNPSDSDRIMLKVSFCFVYWLLNDSYCLQCFATCLSIRNSIPPVKKLTDKMMAWLSVWSEVQMICIWSSWCPCHPIIFCFIKVQVSLAFLMLAYPGCGGKEGIKQVSEWKLFKYYHLKTVNCLFRQ